MSGSLDSSRAVMLDIRSCKRFSIMNGGCRGVGVFILDWCTDWICYLIASGAFSAINLLWFCVIIWCIDLIGFITGGCSYLRDALQWCLCRISSCLKCCHLVLSVRLDFRCREEGPAFRVFL